MTLTSETPKPARIPALWPCVLCLRSGLLPSHKLRLHSAESGAEHPRGQRKCRQGRDGAASETARSWLGSPLPPHSYCTLIFPEWRWPLWLGTATSPAWNALPPFLPPPADSYPPMGTLLRCAIWCGSLSPKFLSGYPCISGPSTGPATVKASACVC